MACAAFELNLIDLKRILLNSVECCLAEKEEKEKNIKDFIRDWDKVIADWVMEIENNSKI